MTDELEPRVVLHRILGVLGGVLGLTSVVGTGCAARSISDGGDEGADAASSTEGSEPSSSDGDDSSSSDGSESSSTDGSEPSSTDGSDTSSEESGDPDDSSDTDDSSDDSSDTDLPPDPDLPPDDGGEEPPDCGEVEVLDDLAEWSIGFEIPGECYDEMWSLGYDPVCFYPPQGTSCEDISVPESCLLGHYQCAIDHIGDGVSCGPYTVDDACCYVIVGDMCPLGRPFTVAGVARVAALRTDPSWSSAPTPDLRGLDDATRAALADAYAQDGLREHASLASFARFTTQLQALGAAPELIAASLRAGQDEIRHAQRCFGLASAYAGRPIGPGPLDVRACLDDANLETIALSLASEGCIAETVSMLLLAAARDRARDPAVRACLSEMLTDELDHVLLAWEALGALLRTHPQLRPPLARVFASAEQHVGFGSITAVPGDAVSMRAHGYLPIDERRTLALDALARVVRPAAQVLLTGHTGAVSAYAQP